MKLRIHTGEIHISTMGNTDIIDITDKITEIFNESDITDGIVSLFVAGATAAITAIEMEPGLIEDFRNSLERIAPKDMNYHHNMNRYDDNGHSHIRASLLGPSITLHVTNGKLILGTWQQIVVVDADTKPRKRKVFVKIIGTKDNVTEE